MASRVLTGQGDFITHIEQGIPDNTPAELALLEANARTVEAQALTSALSGALTRVQVLEAILAHALPLLGASAAAAFFVNESGTVLELMGAPGVKPEHVNAHETLPVSAHRPASIAFRTGQPFWVETIEQLRREFPELAECASQTGRNALACLPVMVHGRTVGVLVFSFMGEHVFSEQERASIKGLVEQSSQALERAQLHESERKARTRFEILARVSDAFAQARLDLPSLLQTIVDEVATTLGDACGVSLLSEDGRFLYQPAYRVLDPEGHALYGEVIANARFSKDEGFTARLLKAEGPLLIPELSPEQALRGSSPIYRRFMERFPFRSLLGVPLRAEGRVLGIITVSRYTPGHPYVTEDSQMLEDIAHRAALAIANARQHEALQIERRRLLRLQEATAALAVAKKLEEVAMAAVTHGLAALDAPRGALWVLSGDGKFLELAGSRGFSDVSVHFFQRIALGGPLHTPVEDSLQSGEPLFIESELEFERCYASLKAASPTLMPTFATACVPLIMGEHRSVGVLNFVFDEPRVFTPEERTFLGIIARICAQALDRTRLYEAEQAARAEAEAQRAYLNRLFEQLPTPIAVVSGPDHVFTLVNTASERLLGQRSLLGKAYREAMPELEGQEPYSVLERVYRTGEPYIGLEKPIRYAFGPGGELREGFFNLFYEPLKNSAGRVEAIVCFCVDVSEQVFARRRVEQAAAEREEALRELEVKRQRLAAVLKEAQAASRAKDEFLAMLGHELRNPLAPILTALQLMQLRAGDSFREERSVLERQVRHLVGLVDDLLDVSRITRGRIELKKKPLGLSEIVDRAVEMVSPLLEERQHRLTNSLPPGFVVEADERRLAQIIGNLLTNAAKYTEPGGHIQIRGESHDGKVALSVQDSGVGIGPELLPRVFDLFIQGERTLDRSQGGLGLGLAIVKNLVELHGGSVKVESEGLGRGSTFTVWFPLSESPLHEAVPDSLPSIPPATSNRVDGRILLVDDNRDAVEVLADLLEALGYEVAVEFDGPGALAAVGSRRPDMAFLDIGLPVMDGYELARRLRETPGMSDVPLVAVTGYGQESDRLRALRAGFQAHLVKPVDLVQLKSLLQKYLSPSTAPAP